MDVETIENELSFLARQKTGFERPDALAAGLHELLALTAVREVAKPMQDSTVARVAALRTVLRNAIDRIRSESTRRTAAVYFFALTPAELEALHLDPQLVASPLGKRREAIATLLRSTPSAFRNRGEHRICALVAGELLCYETELAQQAREPEPSMIDRTDVPSATAVGAAQAVRRAISRLYSNDRGLMPLASLVVPDRVVYYDTALDLTLTDDANDTNRYTYRLTLSFTAALKEYVVGYVTRSQLTDTLLVGSRGITDIYSFSTVDARNKCVECLAGSLNVVTVVTKRDGRTIHKGVRLEEVPPEEYGPYLSEEYDRHGQDIILLRATFPNSETDYRLKIVQQFSLIKSDHFCYWVADRPIYLRQLRVDVRGFTPPGTDRGGRVTLQPFMMATNAEIALHVDGTLTEETDNWLVRGQGFTIVW